MLTPWLKEMFVVSTQYGGRKRKQGMVLRSKADSRLGCGAILIAVSEVAVEVRLELTPRVKVPLA